jgi:hypothetical protein
MKKPVVKNPVHGTPVPKAKIHHHAKPVHVTRAVKTARHAAAVKAAKTRAANAKKAKQHPRRQLALGEGDGVACCSAEALAASLRLAGGCVSDDDVLALYWRTASDPDEGASILATLDAVALHGLGGAKPSKIFHLSRSSYLPICSPVEEATDLAAEFIPLAVPANLLKVGTRASRSNAALILGIDLPGPHTVLATPDGWWSWGELYDPAAFPDAVIEEAWAVEW